MYLITNQFYVKDPLRLRGPRILHMVSIIFLHVAMSGTLIVKEIIKTKLEKKLHHFINFEMLLLNVFLCKHYIYI